MTRPRNRKTFKLKPLPPSWTVIMAIAGYGPDAYKWKVAGDVATFGESPLTAPLSYTVMKPRPRASHVDVGPYPYRQAQEIAEKLIAWARGYIAEQFPRLRDLQLDGFSSVEFAARAEETVRLGHIVRARIGEPTEVRKQKEEDPPFWRTWTVCGPRPEVLEEKLDGVLLKFNETAAVFSAGGDYLHIVGTVYYRCLVVIQ